jgi:two-component system alkaline phosphatase synthesis response regulator PhoP
MTHPGSGASVILADNDAVLRNVIRFVLERGEQQVFVARDGNEAVALARQFTASLALLDVKMPNLDGIAACKKIRALPGYAEVPIIMLTGHGDERTRAAAGEAGATEFMTKPFQPDLLMERVNACIAHSAKAHPAKSAVRDTNAASPGSADPGKNAASGSPPNEHRQPSSGLDTIRIYREVDRIKASDPNRPTF